jgi:hypothetical protein
VDGKILPTFFERPSFCADSSFLVGYHLQHPGAPPSRAKEQGFPPNMDDALRAEAVRSFDGGNPGQVVRDRLVAWVTSVPSLAQRVMCLVGLSQVEYS